MFENKSIIVTGAASGIGRACAVQLLKNGNRVVASDLNASDLEKALGAQTDHLKFLAGDVSKTAIAEAAAELAQESFGRVDGLAHFAAIHSKIDWMETDEEEFNHVLAVNLTGSFLVAKAAAKSMIAHDVKGSIVLTASGSTLIGSSGGQGTGGPAYVSSKGGVLVLIRSMARALGPHGIRINSISPGVVETAMTAEYTAEAMSIAAERAVLSRISTPEEQADAAIWLLSDSSAFVTGETINTNGGLAFG